MPPHLKPNKEVNNFSIILVLCKTLFYYTLSQDTVNYAGTVKLTYSETR